MKQLSVSQLDSLLNFSGLHLLMFTPKWKLARLHPNHRSFLGWDDSDFDNFRFKHNFLQPNNLDLSTFLGHFQNKNYVSRKYYWRDAEANISGPFETYFRLKRTGDQIKMIMAFVKISEQAEIVKIKPVEKSKILMAKGLTDYIRSVLNPMGLLITRLDILKNRGTITKDFESLIKVSQRIENQLHLLNNVIFRNNITEPVTLDLNRCFKESFLLLNSDLFFKHQLRKNIKYEPGIPESKIVYNAITGIFFEFYYFLKKFSSLEQEYLMQFEIIWEDSNIGFQVNFLGDFGIPGDLDLHLPLTLEGDSQQIILESIDGLDIQFLAYCLRKLDGYLLMVFRRDMMKLRLTFPLLPG
jgi:hypothetical protein